MDSSRSIRDYHKDLNSPHIFNKVLRYVDDIIIGSLDEETSYGFN